MPACFQQPANAFEHVMADGILQAPNPVRQQPQFLTQQPKILAKPSQLLTDLAQFFTDFAPVGQHAFDQASDERKIRFGHGIEDVTKLDPNQSFAVVRQGKAQLPTVQTS